MPCTNRKTGERPDAREHRDRWAALLVLCFTTLPSVAQTRFDPATGTGYVPAQLAQQMLQWGPGQLRTQAETLGFVYKGEEHFQGLCAWQRPDGRRAQEPQSQRMVVEKTIRSTAQPDPLDRHRISGFLLTGYLQGPAPWPRPGQPCTTADGQAGYWVTAQPSRYADLYLRSGHALIRLPAP